MKTVFTNGCFDVLHAGHIYILEQARKQGDHLTVGLNSDESVRLLKGAGRPLQPFSQRVYAVSAVRWVDRVVEVASTNMVQTLEELRPSVWVKGGDYTMESLNPSEVAVAKRLGIEIVLIPIRYTVHTSGLLR